MKFSTNQQFRKTLSSTALVFSSLCMLPSVASADVMLGAYLPNDGYDRQQIVNFNEVVPKKLAYVNVFSAFSHDWDNLYWQSSNVVAENAYPMISWMPIDLDRRDANLLPEIAIGMWDDYLLQWGQKLNAWVASYPESEKPRVAIRFAHEFNGNWYPYSNTPESYKAAWQHIHDMFEEIGANQHVDWIWSASKTNVDDYSDFTVYYPGDTYVDWTSLDGYNWGSNYSPNGWSSFKNVFTNSYRILVDNYPEKPIMIAETGSAEPTDIPNINYGMYGDNSDAYESKSVWIAGMLETLENDFPAVRALSLFNNNKELTWSITTENSTGMDSWITGTQSPHFTSEFLVASVDVVDVAMDVAEPVLFDVEIETNSKGKGKNKKGIKTSNRTVVQQAVSAGNSHRDRKQLNAAAQASLASSNKPDKISDAADLALAKKLRELSREERRELRSLKMSVIEY